MIKNDRGEEIQVRRFYHRRNAYVDIRIFWPDAEGELRPGKGLRIREELLEELISTLKTAAEKP